LPEYLFYDHEVDERSPEAIESGATMSQGRRAATRSPNVVRGWKNVRAKYEQLGERATERGRCESAVASDFDIAKSAAECGAMKQGDGLGYVSYALILKRAASSMREGKKIQRPPCGEYKVTFDSQAVKGVKVCLGTSDDLPYRVIGEDYTATYNYEPVARLAVADGREPLSSAQAPSADWACRGLKTV